MPLSNWEVEEGNVDILVRVIVGDESRPLLHHKPLASVLQIRLEPQVLVGNGFLEKIIELHHVREVDEHRARLAPSHRLNLRLVVRLRRIIPNPKAEIPSTNFHKKYTDIYIHTHTKTHKIFQKLKISQLEKRKKKPSEEVEENGFDSNGFFIDEVTTKCFHFLLLLLLLSRIQKP